MNPQPNENLMKDSKQIATARALVALGLPVPNPAPKKAIVCNDDGTRFDPDVRILFVRVATEAGPELLPVLDDWALLGWLIAELERIVGPVDIIDNAEPGFALPPDWSVSRCTGWHSDTGHNGETRIEALTAALKAAKEAGK